MATRIRRGAKPHLYLAEWREHRGLSVEQLANRMDVDRTSVWRWETGQRRVPPERQAQIAAALDLDGPESLWRPPASRPSIDAMLSGAPDDIHETIFDLARRLTRRAS